MNKAVPWSVRGVGFNVREAAQEAAHREGMTLSQWLSEAISNRAAQAGIDLEDLDADDHLDAVAERLRELDTRRTETAPGRSTAARLRSDMPDGRMQEGREQTRMAMRLREPVGRRAEAPASFDPEALLEKAVDLFERRSAKSHQQTAEALASVARIMEANDSGANNLKAAFSRLESRLDAMARRPAPETRQSLPLRNDSEPVSRLEAKLNSILAAVIPANQDTLQQSRADLHGTSSRRSLGEAIAQIARRQHDLEEPAPQQTPHAPGRAEAPVQAALAPANPFDRPASQGDVAVLASKLEDMRRAVLERLQQPAPVFDLDKLHAEIAHMSTALPDLAKQSSVAALDSSIRVLAREIEVSRNEGANETLLRPLERSVAELRRSLAEINPRTTITGLESEIRALGSKLEGLGRHDVETGAFLQVQQQTQEIRDLLTAAAARPAAVEKIEQQVAQLARSLDRQQQIAAVANEGRAPGSVTDEIRTLLNERPQSAALAQIEERLEAIAGRVEDALAEVRDGRNHSSIEHHIDRVRQDLSARIAASTNAPADTRALEDLVRGLADKMERAHQPDSNAQAFEALELQIGELAARLDRSSTGLNSLAYLEQTIGDLFAKLDATQQAAVEAAETAARNATRDSLREVLAQGAFEPRHAVASAGFDHEDVTRELSELRGLQDAADRRTHSTLNAVHETLEKVVDRLAMLEEELGEVRPDVSHATLASGPAPQFARPPRSEDPVEPRFVERDAKPSRSADPDDFLIEPGRGFPGRGAKEVSKSDSKRKAAVDRRPGVADSAVTGRADFIAAARRAAQAAQMESAAAAMQARPAPVAEGEGAVRLNLVEQARTFIAQHKRPVVLSVAALFLVVGAYAVVKSLGRAPSDLSYEAPKEQTQDRANAAPAPVIGTSAGANPSSTTAQTPSLGGLLAQAQSPQPSAAPQKMPAIAGSDPIVVNSITPRPKDVATPADTTRDMASAMLQSQADLGNAKAQFELASRYAEGRALTRDMKAAAQWYEKAAMQGLASAQYRLGSQYEKGLGVTRDAAQAKAWYQKAAEQGNVRAMHNLAVLLAEIGESGKPDYAAAAQWFSKAAEYGVRDSQYNYAILLARGLGVAQNLASSYSWFAIAAAQGDDDAGKKRDDVAARLSAGDLAAAKAVVEAFRPRPADPAANEVQWPSSAAVQPPPTKPQRPKVSQL